MTRLLLTLTALSASLPADDTGPEAGLYGAPIEVTPLE